MNQFNQIAEMSKKFTDSKVVFGGDFNIRDAELKLVNDGNYFATNIRDCWVASGQNPESKFTWDLGKCQDYRIVTISALSSTLGIPKWMDQGSSSLRGVYFLLVLARSFFTREFSSSTRSQKSPRKKIQNALGKNTLRAKGFRVRSN